MKRIIGFLVVFCMILPMFNVYAGNDSIKLEDFNATTTAVMLNFSMPEDDSIDNAKECITLEKFYEGERKAVDNIEITATGNTVVIAPSEGIEPEVYYNVIVDNRLMTENQVYISNETETGWFKVELVFSDDFEVKYNEAGEPVEPWYMGVDNKNNPKLLSHYWDIAVNRLSYANGVLAGKNNSIYAGLLKNGAGLSDVTFDDYTVETKVSFPALDDRFEVLMRSQYNNYSGHSKGYCFEISKYKTSDRDTTAKTAPVIITAKRNNSEISTSDTYNLSYEGFTLRASAVGGKLQYYVDNNKLIDVTDESPLSATNNVVTYSFATPSNLANATIDDVYITKCQKNIELEQHELRCFADEEKIILALAGVEADNTVFADSVSYELYKNGEIIDSTLEISGNEVYIFPIGGIDETAFYIIKVKEGVRDDSGTKLGAEALSGAFEIKDGIFEESQIEYPDMVINDAFIETDTKEFVIKTAYSGSFDNASEYTVYASKTANGGFYAIKEGTVVSDEIRFDIDESYIDKYFYVEVEPKDVYGFTADNVKTDVFTGLFKPIVNNVSFEGDITEGSVELKYDFADIDGTDTDVCVIEWLYADPADGVFTKVSEDMLDESGMILNTEELKDKYIKVRIIPKSGIYPDGDEYNSQILCREFMPFVEDLKIEGECKLNSELTATYIFKDYNDIEKVGTESNSEFRWLRYNSKDSEEFEVIEGANRNTYTITEQDYEKYIRVEITPKTADKSGEATLSPAYVCPRMPVATGVTIDGDIREGNTVTGNYKYLNESGVSEGESVFKWYMDGEEVGTGISFTIPKSASGNKLVFSVTPVAVEEPKNGEEKKSAEVTISKKKSSSGGSSGGGGSSSSSKATNSIPVSPSPVVPEFPMQKFNDVDENHWCYEAINELSKKGIINGKENNCFKPDDLVLREELVKMICLAFELKSQDGEIPFTDVDKGSWYADYIRIGVQNNIVNGISETEFGVHKNVTRQDLCTMLYRIKNGETDNEPDFIDKAEIARYAIEAVAYLNETGVINGYSDGTFKPLKACTRAEAAKIIYALTEK